jgi:hypothetical protein
MRRTTATQVIVFDGSTLAFSLLLRCVVGAGQYLQLETARVADCSGVVLEYETGYPTLCVMWEFMRVIETAGAVKELFVNRAASTLRYWRYRYRYDKMATRPYEIIWVDPDSITHCTLLSLMGQLDISSYGSDVMGGK